MHYRRIQQGRVGNPYEANQLSRLRNQNNGRNYGNRRIAFSSNTDIVGIVRDDYSSNENESLDSKCSDTSVHNGSKSRKKYRTGPFKALATSLIFAAFFSCGSQEEKNVKYLNTPQGKENVMVTLVYNYGGTIEDSIGKPRSKGQDSDKARTNEAKAESELETYIRSKSLEVKAIQNKYGTVTKVYGFDGIKGQRYAVVGIYEKRPEVLMVFDYSNKKDPMPFSNDKINPFSSVYQKMQELIKKYQVGFKSGVKELGEKALEKGKSLYQKGKEFDEKHDVSGKVKRGAKEAYEAGKEFSEEHDVSGKIKGAGKKVVDGIGGLLKGDKNRKEEQ